MFLSAGVHPDFYPEQIAVVLLGSAVLCPRDLLQVTANVILNPGEGLVRAIAEKTHKRFGIVKVFFDTSLVAGRSGHLACRVRTVEGFREGTVISAILVGYIILGITFGVLAVRPRKMACGLTGRCRKKEKKFLQELRHFAFAACCSAGTSFAKIGLFTGVAYTMYWPTTIMLPTCFPLPGAWAL